MLVLGEAMSAYETYDDIPLEVILPMNIVYLCSEAVGMELEDFKSWTLKAMESQHTQSRMTLDVWEAVVRNVESNERRRP